MDPQRYLAKHELFAHQIDAPPAPTLGMIVVIPARAEPELLTTLRCLALCDAPSIGVEIIVVLNASEDDAPSVAAQNRRTHADIAAWATTGTPNWLDCHVINHPRLATKDAGVGLARKLGLDEAVRRFWRAQQPDGLLVWLDADTLCDPNYLTAIAEYFRRYPKAPGGSIYFEHPVAGGADSAVSQAIAHYELFLRYYRNGLRYAHFPYAHHTVGSAIVVREQAYRALGGMNRRQAGEDFYFVQKMAALGHYDDITTTTVRPAARDSSRTPFGTGRAVAKFLASGAWLTYDPGVFSELRALGPWVNAVSGLTNEPVVLPSTLAAYLESVNVAARLEEIGEHTGSGAQFRKRFYRWFNAFRCLKFVHFAHEHGYQRVGVVTAATQLLKIWGEIWVDPDVWQLLHRFREIDRGADLPKDLPPTAALSKPFMAH